MTMRTTARARALPFVTAPSSPARRSCRREPGSRFPASGPDVTPIKYIASLATEDPSGLVNFTVPYEMEGFFRRK